MDWWWMAIVVMIAAFLFYLEKERLILKAAWLIMAFMGIGWITLHLLERNMKLMVSHQG
jgi:hypothetical protein